MGGGTDDKAHRPTRPVLWRGSSGHEERIGIVLGERGEGCGVPFPDPADALEVVLVKLCGEPGVGGDREVVEDIGNDTSLF